MNLKWKDVHCSVSQPLNSQDDRKEVAAKLSAIPRKIEQSKCSRCTIQSVNYTPHNIIITWICSQ